MVAAVWSNNDMLYTWLPVFAATIRGNYNPPPIIKKNQMKAILRSHHPTS